MSRLTSIGQSVARKVLAGLSKRLASALGPESTHSTKNATRAWRLNTQNVRVANLKDSTLTTKDARMTRLVSATPRQ